ncbi:hypothetical protein FRC01_005914, partial [Tulasnella sp. 417]
MVGLCGFHPKFVDDLRPRLENHLCGPSLLPNLRSIKFQLWEDQPQIIEILSLLPAGLRDLDLHIGCKTDAEKILQCFASIPLNHLEDVQILYSNRIAIDPVTMGAFLRPNRATLADLNLRETPRTVSALKQLETFPRLKRLRATHQGAASELPEFFDLIGSSFPRLRSTVIQLDEAITEEVPAAAFEGLAACRELQSVCLNTRRWTSLSREDVHRFGSWWPLMEKFSLSYGYYPDQAMTPLGILEDFAR